MTLPNLLGLGAQRAGTTWLDKVLRGHPDIFMSSRRKEIHFFDRYYRRGVDWYSTYFPRPSLASGFKWIGEITPAYLYDPSVPARISETLPDCHFVVTLRNPADRAYSQYCYHVRNTADRRTFTEFIDEERDALERGLYAEQLNRYFALFPREKFLILVFEELIARPLDGVKDVARFLDIDPEGFNSNDFDKKVNASSQVKFVKAYAKARRTAQWLRARDMNWIVNVVKHIGGQDWFGQRTGIAPLDPLTRTKVLGLYNEDIRQLESLTGSSFDIWLDGA